MRKLIAVAIVSSLAFTGAVEAKGCLKGAAVGAIAGHYAHHHAARLRIRHESQNLDKSI